MPDDTTDGATPGSTEPPGMGHHELSESRLGRLQALDVTPRRTELRRLAAANRIVIDRLTSTTASVEELAEAADALESVAALLAALPGGQSYEGFREAANAGAVLSDEKTAAQRQIESGEYGDDPERYAFFDHSPFIGLSNPLSPPVHLEYLEDRVIGTAAFGAAYEGPPGCVHGGYVAAVFDEVLGATQSLSGTAGMTARLVVNFRSPTPLRQELSLVGRLVHHEGRKITAAATLHAGDTLCAEAEALFISFDADRFRALLEARDGST